MASSAMDPLAMLQSALAKPANSQEQADILSSLRDHLEAHPGPIRVLVNTFINTVVRAPDSQFKRWVLELLNFGLSRADITADNKINLASTTLDQLTTLFDDPSPMIVKLVIQCITSAYPLLFYHLCINRNNPGAWATLTKLKTRILDFLTPPNVPLSIKLPAVKFLQRAILVQTRGNSDPRLQKKSDYSVSSCPADHPFINASKLESEGQKLMELAVTQIYTSRSVDLLTAYITIWSTISKARPLLVPFVVETFKQWTPGVLAGTSALGIKSVEKAIRILLIHISRIPTNGAIVPQIHEVLNVQAARMDKAAAEEKKRKAAALLAPEQPKRPTTETTLNDAKRAKIESEGIPPTPAPTAAPAATPGASAALLASFDFTTLPAPLITDLIVANLEAFSEASLNDMVKTYRSTRGLARESVASAIPPPPFIATAPAQPVASTSSIPPPRPVPTQPVKEEPIDPLKMDIDQDEMEYEPERLNAELAATLPVPEPQFDETKLADITLLDFTLPPPRDLDSGARTDLIRDVVIRIRDGADEMKANSNELMARSGSLDMWMLLVVRMITRVVLRPPPPESDTPATKEEAENALEARYEKQDQMRTLLSEYIMADFGSRIQLATTWMNEEWYNDQLRVTSDTDWRPNYETWLNQLVVSYQTLLEGKDRMFARFLLDLPSIPVDVLNVLRDLCVEEDSPDRMQVGFTTLRGLVIQRPTLRDKALDILLELTTHSERKIRAAAINTVKLWVSNRLLMTEIRGFAIQMLKRLQLKTTRPQPNNPDSSNAAEPDVEMTTEEVNPSSTPNIPLVMPPKALPEELEPGEEGEEDPDAMEEDDKPSREFHSSYLPETIDLPAEKSQILQHIELLFALSVKVPQFLDAIFRAYGTMEDSVQSALQELLTPLISSLGPDHAKLISLVRNCPPGSESLALGVVRIFSKNGKLGGSQLVEPLKSLISEKTPDPRLLIPIIHELDKTDILRYLPGIVKTLNGDAESKNAVKIVFKAIIAKPAQSGHGANMPRLQQTQMLTPAELMILLHHSEAAIGRKSAIEAIGICFSMTDIYNYETLASVMQHIMDETELPVLFMRTVIQAVSTYKSLVPFVSTTLFSRLITKKIWTNPPLWQGFIHCAKVIAPSSFGALLQLPKDQLRELVNKQPSLKAGLREHVLKKAPNKARVSGFLDIFGPDEAETVAPQPETVVSADVSMSEPS